MRLTRWSHSCVALEHDGRTLVLDPGEWSEARALRGADAVEGPHASVLPGQELGPHLGYVVRAGGESVHHPGDGLTPPGEPVDVLLAAMQASWLKTPEAVDFVRAVAPAAPSGSTTASSTTAAGPASTAGSRARGRRTTGSSRARASVSRPRPGSR